MEVMSLAERQGVLAIAFDGVQYFDKLSNHNCMPDIDSLMEWLGQASYNEVVYEEYEKTVAHLSKLFGDQSLRAIVMKDYGCSLNYPKPNHRPCGDIDIYVANHKGKHDRVLVDFANQILVNAGAEDISHGNEHHSVLSFEGHTIENHWSILDINTHKSSRYLDGLLEKLAGEPHSEKEVNGTIVCLPSVRFNSIHLLRHMANDFATVKTTLRHVLDWSTFVVNNQVDWDYVHEVAHKSNMNRFLDAINEICVEYLGYPKEMFPVEEADVKLRDRV